MTSPVLYAGVVYRKRSGNTTGPLEMKTDLDGSVFFLDPKTSTVYLEPGLAWDTAEPSLDDIVSTL